MGLHQAQQEFMLQPNKGRASLEQWGWQSTVHLTQNTAGQDFCLSYLCKIKRKQWSISILWGFNSYTMVCKRAKQSQFCFQMKSYTNLMEPLSRDNQRQRVAELQLKDALDALLKPANTWEASPDSALVSAAGTCPHTKDKPKGTSRGPFQHRPPQQPQAQAAREQPSLQG